MNMVRTTVCDPEQQCAIDQERVEDEEGCYPLQRALSGE